MAVSRGQGSSTRAPEPSVSRPMAAHMPEAQRRVQTSSWHSPTGMCPVEQILHPHAPAPAPLWFLAAELHAPWLGLGAWCLALILPRHPTGENATVPSFLLSSSMLAQRHCRTGLRGHINSQAWLLPATILSSLFFLPSPLSHSTPPPASSFC